MSMRSLYGGLRAMDWKMPSAMVDRQMLPRQTKRTEIWSGMLSCVLFADENFASCLLSPTGEVQSRTPILLMAAL